MLEETFSSFSDRILMYTILFIDSKGMRFDMSDIIQKGIPFSNSPKLHNEIGNVKTDKKALAKSALRNADEFYMGAGLIFKQSPLELIQVISVNLAFSCELYIKAMLYELSVGFGKTHRISDLYRLLPEEQQKRVKENVYFQHEKKDNFELVLEEISDAFVFLRYAHERKAIVSNWDGLSAISTAIMKMAKDIIGETK